MGRETRPVKFAVRRKSRPALPAAPLPLHIIITQGALALILQQMEYLWCSCSATVFEPRQAVGVSNYGPDAVKQAHAALKARGVQLGSNQVQFSLNARCGSYDFASFFFFLSPGLDPILLSFREIS